MLIERRLFDLNKNVLLVLFWMFRNLRSVLSCIIVDNDDDDMPCLLLLSVVLTIATCQEFICYDQGKNRNPRSPSCEFFVLKLSI